MAWHWEEETSTKKQRETLHKLLSLLTKEEARKLISELLDRKQKVCAEELWECGSD